MPNGQITITVATQSTELQALIDKLNAGTISVKEYNKTVRDLRNSSMVGSQAQMELKNVVAQVGQQTLTTNGQMMQSYFKLGESIRSMQMAFVQVAAGAMAFKEAFDLAKSGAQLELFRNTVENMAKKDGVDFANMMALIDEKTKGTLDDMDALQAVLKLRMLGTDFAKIPDILQAAKERAEMLNIPLQEVLQRLEIAASTGRTMGLSEMAIAVDAKEVYAQYAAQIGVATDQLTKAQKTQAVFDVFVKKTAEDMKSVNKEAMDQVDSFDRAKKSVKDVGDALGELLASASPLIDFLAKVVRLIALGIESLTHFGKALWAIKSLNFAAAMQEFDATGKVGDKVMEVLGLHKQVTHEMEKQKALASSGVTGTGASTETEAERKKAEDALNKQWAWRGERAAEVHKQAIDYYMEEQKAAAELDKQKQQADAQYANKSAQLANEARARRAKETADFLKAQQDERTAVAQTVSGYINPAVQSWAHGLMGVVTGTMTVQQAFRNMGQVVVGMLEQIIEKLIATVVETAILKVVLSAIGLSSGGDVIAGGSTGSPLTGVGFAAKGGNFDYGSHRNVIVGEAGPELMQVGSNGVRIIPNHQLGQMNQYGSAAHYAAQSSPAFHVHNHIGIDDQGLYVHTQIGKQKFNKRVMG